MASTASTTIFAPKSHSSCLSLRPFSAFAPSTISFDRSGCRVPFFSQALMLVVDYPKISSLCAARTLERHLSADVTAVPMSGAAKPTVLVSEKLGEAGLELLREYANVDCPYDITPEELCAKISLCDALVVRSGTKVTREVFEAAKNRLKFVGRAGVGIDNVDLQAATENGCLVVNAPTANTIAAAEHGIALLMAIARNVAQSDASVKAGEC